ncbi:MAG: hypothetical protein C0469_17845 [Cyanobacteria bacterium DS2.3.42]|nr:hypothetical protein [Cyanobacteria bacterium DS2.3.42]
MAANLLYCCGFKIKAVQTVNTAKSATNSNKASLLFSLKAHENKLLAKGAVKQAVYLPCG